MPKPNETTEDAEAARAALAEIAIMAGQNQSIARRRTEDAIKDALSWVRKGNLAAVLICLELAKSAAKEWKYE